jgi:tRNA pseudouridine55 synthase
MDGILLIDKPSGMTSRDVVNKVSKLLKIKKMGHTGTLDPLATGVLVLCLGKATKIVDIITSYDKEYIAEITLGIETDTLDSEGKIIKEAKVNKIPSHEIIKVLNTFLGKQKQEVPIYSSVKIHGKKLYEYARSNKEVELPIRDIEIKKIELIDDVIYEEDRVKFKIRCLVSKGTYIRSLAKDIGSRLGYPSYMSSLRRIQQGIFNINNCYTITDIENNEYSIIGIKEALKEYPMIVVDNILAKKILNGAKVDKFFNDDIAIIIYKDEVIAIYQQDKNDISKVKPLKMIKSLDFL